MDDKLTPKEWFLKVEGESMLDAVVKDRLLRGDSHILNEDGRLFCDQQSAVSLPEGAGAPNEAAPLSLDDARQIAAKRIEFLSREANRFLDDNDGAMELSRHLFATSCLTGRLLHELCNLKGADLQVVEYIERCCLAAEIDVDDVLLDYLRDSVIPDVRKRIKAVSGGGEKKEEEPIP